MKKTVVFLVICAIALLLSFLLLRDYFNLKFWIENFQNLKLFVDNHFLEASLIFLLIHFLMALLPIPWLSTLSIIGGLFLGAKASILYSVLMTIIGGTMSFVLMRYFLRDFITLKFSKIQNKYMANESDNIRTLISLRIFPLLPFFVVTAISSLSKIRLINFLWASPLGRMPIIVIYSFFGEKLMEVKTLDGAMNLQTIIVLLLLSIIPWALKYISRLYMKKIIWILFFCFSVVELRADSTLNDFTISAVVSDDFVQIQNIAQASDIKLNDMFAIYSHETHQVLGYAEVTKIDNNSDFFEAKVETHHQSGMIRSGNYLVRLDLSSVNNSIPARIELLSYSKRKVASKYRHLVYTGFFLGQTAQPLLKKEFIIGPSFFAYGYNDRLQFHSNVLNSFFGTPNVGYKFLFGRNSDYAFSFSQEFNYYPDAHKTYHEFSFHLDMYSNSKFVSYGKLKLFTKRPETKTLTNSDEYVSDLSTELQLAYGYVADNWNRIIFGPKVDFEKKKVGGSVGYYVIDKEFHMLIGASANDFSEATLGREGYILNLDFWWRF